MTIKLIGRIDSSNANETEAKIALQIGDFKGELTLDASDLEYISSAGLRIILRLKKANPTTKVINCNSEVYEIFDMTGFTEMMDISKAYRKISVEGCEVIGEGSNGVVYRTDPDTIVKVYKSHNALAEIHNERELARKAFIMGIPTAIPYDVVQVGDLYGSVFELLDAASFVELINENPASVPELAKESVKILKLLHSTALKHGELPSKKQEAIGWAEFCRPYLPEAIGDKLIELFNAIPEADTMLHGDFHIKNLMRQNGEILLIDMDTLAQGNPVFEFALIYAAYIGFASVDEKACERFLGIPEEQCKAFWEATVQAYFEGKTPSETDAAVNQIKIVCYTRILHRTVRRVGLDNPEGKALADYCTNYLTENVPKTEKLYF